MTKKKPYRIFAAYDSETSNITNGIERPFAFPCVHQIGIFDSDLDYKSITSENVFDVIETNIFRHAIDVFSFFNFVLNSDLPFVPVVMVHNLSFDMWGLSSYFASHDCEILAKSATKPITIKVFRDCSDDIGLIFWDTLGFFGKPLSTMGDECGIKKLVGAWDYLKIRTPQTPLTDNEIDYCLHDIYVLFAYLGFYCRNNLDVNEELLASKVSTKTGAVRAKKTVAFDRLKSKKLKHSVGDYWFTLNQRERPKSDDELYTLHAATRGGFVFCAQNTANIPFDLTNTDRIVLGFDATSQHPAQMVTHVYPVRFLEEPPELLELSLKLIDRISVDEILTNWYKPFTVAFYACFYFENLRLKGIFERDGISPLASSRFGQNIKEYEDQAENAQLFNFEASKNNYKDVSYNGVFSFGKLVSADYAYLYLTELEYWCIRQCFDFDNVKPIHGYGTDRFVKPTDMAVLSVMKFYNDKQIFKKAKESYEKNAKFDYSALKGFVADSLIHDMQNGTADNNDIDAQYMFLKSNLNALFGIEATNEAKPDYFIDENGIFLEQPKGLEDLPKKSKAWYQFGQRIVGWSRVSQIVHMLTISDYVDCFINGDTDSLKALCKRENKHNIKNVFDKNGEYIRAAQYIVCERVKTKYPDQYVDLDYLGKYELEFEAEKFCAGWNKSYMYMQHDKRQNKDVFKITMAGIPSSSKIHLANGEILDHSLENFCNELFRKGKNFKSICNLLLGYNLTIDATITGLNNRFASEWAKWYEGTVTDYLGNTYHVKEPYALALSAAPKETNSVKNGDNLVNMAYSLKNNSKVNIVPHIIAWPIDGVPQIIEV